MKIKTLLQLVCILPLIGSCMSGSNPDPAADSTYNPPYTPPAVVPPTTVTPPSGNDQRWTRIPMHYKILKGQPHLWNEAGGARSLTLSQYTSAGSYSVNLSSTSGLVVPQLISYRGTDGNFYSVQLQSITGNTVRLATPLERDVYKGNNAWNFYEDGAHPNWAGSFAIADFSVRYLGWSRLNQGKHVLFGDSWFSRNSVFQRLSSRLPGASFSNKGVGGHTASDLLARFDADVRWQNPNFVWIMTGTNDYWQNVSSSVYKSNMRQLINKVLAIGATPIVFDASVGPLNFGSDWKTQLSRSYVVSMDQLVNEN